MSSRILKKSEKKVKKRFFFCGFTPFVNEGYHTAGGKHGRGFAPFVKKLQIDK
jgi:hypothetical protein